MTRVLLVGEFWFVHSVHPKGFDSFTTSEFTVGGIEFVVAHWAPPTFLGWPGYPSLFDRLVRWLAGPADA